MTRSGLVKAWNWATVAAIGYLVGAGFYATQRDELGHGIALGIAIFLGVWVLCAVQMRERA